MRKIICLFVCLFVATVSNSCQSEDIIETSSQSDLEYKVKLEKLIKFENATDLKTSKIDVSNALRFKNYEAAYNYFKNNREFVSDTITIEAKLVNVDYNTIAKDKSVHKTSDIVYGSDVHNYYTSMNNIATISGSLGTVGIVSVQSRLSFNISYAYTIQNNTKTYYSSQMSSAIANVDSITYGGTGTATKNGSVTMYYSSGFAGSWLQNAQCTYTIAGSIASDAMIIRGNFNVNLGNVSGSSISLPTVSQSITANLLQIW